MAEAKQATDAASRAEGLLAGIPTWAIAVIALVIVAAAVALFVWWYTKKRKPTAAPKEPAKAPALGKSALKDVWSAFLDKAPRQARYYPVFVVLGDLHAGKSHLIDNRVDWKREEAQFHRSSFDSDQLKIYLGPRVIVQEISATLLRDHSEEAKAALSALWSALGDRTPTVVLALDAGALKTGNRDDTRELAQTARGKINLLSSLHRKAPIKVQIDLTHLDGFPGFAELALGLKGAGFEGRLPIHAHRGGRGLSGCLTPLDAYRPDLITSSHPGSSEKIALFFEEMKAVLAALSPFVAALCSEEDLSTTPALGDLALSGYARDQHVGNPFLSDPAAVDRDTLAANHRIQRNCLAALGLAVSLTAGFFGYHRYKLHQAEEAVNAFVRASTGAVETSAGDDLTRAERLAGERLDELARSERLWPPLRVSFTDDKQRARKSFTDALRTTYLTPLLAGSLDRDRLVYAVGLVYAARDNDLGALVRADAPRWVDRLGLPEAVPEDYVASSDRAWPEVVKATAAPAANSATAADTQAWYGYLTELEGLFGSDEITPAQLKAAQQHAIPLRDALEQARYYPTIKAIVAVLARDKRLDLEGMFGALSEPSPTPAWVNDNHDTLVSLLALVRNSALPAVRVEGLSLQQLLNVINPSPPAAAPAASAAPIASAAPAASAPADPAPAATSKEYRLSLNEQSFTFRTGAWSEVLLHSRTGLVVDAFIADNRSKGRYPFFASDPPPYVDVGAVGTPGRGPAAVIRGVYSRDAVEGDVKPALLGFDKQLEAAPLTANHRRVLTSYVLEESRRYADRYRDELRGYYQSYRYNPATAAALEYDLAEIALPSSWLAAFLTTVANQSTIDLKGTAPYLDTLGTNLELFKPVAAIAGKLDKYTAVVSKMLPPPSPPSDKPPVLTDLLTPEGKAALEILRGEKDNALAAVEPPLDSAGLPRDFRGPFLSPVLAAYSFGRASIEQTIAQQWKQMVAQSAPVLSRYPFDRRADQEASAADLEALFAPGKGRFVDGFTRLIAPVCDSTEGRWYARTAPSGLESPRLPASLLRSVNALSRMSARLWDKEGKPQALAIGAQAEPLPAPQPGDSAVTLSQLHTGETSVFGFNQTPAPQPLNLIWWNQGTSSIDIQILAPESGKKVYQTLAAPDSAWSFYRLLDRAASTSKQLEVTWQVPSETAGRTKAIRFVLAADPWAPFQLPPLSP